MGILPVAEDSIESLRFIAIMTELPFAKNDKGQTLQFPRNNKYLVQPGCRRDHSNEHNLGRVESDIHIAQKDNKCV